MIELKTREHVHVQRLSSLSFKFGHEHKNTFNSLSFIKTSNIGKVYLQDIQTIKKDGELLYDWKRSVIHAWRNPTQSEIKFGLGATHYKEFDSIDFFQWLKPDGSLKKMDHRCVRRFKILQSYTLTNFKTCIQYRIL